MREESNRVIKNLQDNIETERRQRQATLKAMQANAAIEEKQFTENTRIALKNIESQGMQDIANAQGAVKQANLDAKASNSIVQSLVDFSKTAQSLLNKQAEIEIQNQTQLGLTSDTQSIADQIEQNKQAQEAMLVGGMQLNANIQEDAVLSGEPEVETLKRYRANHGLNGISAQVNDNRVAVQAYETLMQRRMVDNQTVFTTSSGKQFRGIDASVDGELYRELHKATLKDVSQFMGFVDPAYLQSANKTIGESFETRLGQVNTTQISRDREALVIRAKEIGSSGTPSALITAFTEIARIEGYDAAHNYFTDLIKTGTVAPEIIGELVLPDGSGKKYSVQYGKSRFAPALKELNAETVKARNEQTKLDKARTREYVYNNFDDIYAFAKEDPERAEKEFFKLFRGQIPDELKNILSMAKDVNLDLKEDEIRKMALEGSLSQTYINNLTNDDLVKLANDELTKMRIRKYSVDKDGNNVISATEDTYTPLIEGVESYANDLADFSSLTPGATSAQAELNKAAILSFIQEDLTRTGDASLTLENVEGFIATASLQPNDPNYDPKNPFSYTETSGRRVFRHIGNVDEDKQNERARVAQAIVRLNPNRTPAKLGEILKQKDLLFTQKQYDEMKDAAEAGLPIPYTDGISFVGDTFKQSYIQILNTAAQLQGLDPIDVNVNPTTALPNKYQRLLNSGNYFKINRAKQTVTGNLSTNLRTSMGGSVMQPLQNLILSGEGGFTSANRGIAGDTPEGVPGLDTMTVGDWKNLYEQGYNALGGPQFIKNTFNGAVNRLNLSDDTVMSGDMQMELFNELILGGVKRPRLSAYLNGTSDDLTAALEDLSLEFASVANPYTGITSYPNQGGNAASISVDAASEILQQLRNRLTNQ